MIEVIIKVTCDNTDKSLDTFDCLTEYNFDENTRREFTMLLTGCLIDITDEVMLQCRPKRRCFLPTAQQPLPPSCDVVTNFSMWLPQEKSVMLSAKK